MYSKNFQTNLFDDVKCGFVKEIDEKGNGDKEDPDRQIEPDVRGQLLFLSFL